MANSATRAINYKPRMTQFEAYDRLPLTLKRCLQECVQEFDAYAVLRFFEGYGLQKAIEWIHSGDVAVMKQGFRMKAFEKNVPTSFVACNVKPLRTYGITPRTRLGRSVGA